jgi:signal transduction histidine kinase
MVFGTEEFRRPRFGNTVATASFALTLLVVIFELRRLRPLVLIEQPRIVPFVPFQFPRLVWPLAVVLLPLLILGALAVWTLNSDRRSAREEARAHAGEIASTVLAAAEEDLNIVRLTSGGFLVLKGQNTFSVSPEGKLVSPPPWVWPPKPAPLTSNDFKDLRTNKLVQWREAEAAFAAGKWTNSAELYLKFLDGRRQSGSEPMADFNAGIANSRFRPLAQSRRAAAIEKSGDVPGAISAYNDIFDGFVIGPEAISESGVALAPLAILKILDLAQDNPKALPEDWRRNPQFLVSQLSQNGDASPITEEAIQRLRRIASSLVASSALQQSTNQLFDLWDRYMRARQFYAEASAQMSTNAWPDVFWVNGTETWLAVKQKTPFIYAALPEAWLSQQLQDVAKGVDRRGDFVTTADFATKKISVSAAGNEKEPDESAVLQRQHSVNWPISLSVALKDPGEYYRAVQRRQVLFSLLVSGALVAGFASAVALRRSLIRQQLLNEQKSNFVSSVSHELRAPIASVRLMAESLERGKVAVGARQNEYYRFIVQECRRLSSLIENVLDFSRIEQGRKQYEFEPTDVLALTRETVKLMEPYAEEKGVQLKLETSNIEHRTPNVEVEMDGRAMQQALVNLIDNAIKHSAKGQMVTVGLDAESANGTGQNTNSEAGKMPVLLYVEDHGPGIPPAEHEKIFERFYRLGSELRRETQGVGIGLSIVRHIVEAHGGKVTVRSNVGEGSRFTIVLPVKVKPQMNTDEHR